MLRKSPAEKPDGIIDMQHHDHDTMTQESDRSLFGFWIYLMSDCILFATLFATYAVLHGNTYGGPGARELFSLPFVLVESMILLTSSFVMGLAMLQLHRGRTALMMVLMGVAGLLGALFLVLEAREFTALIAEGNGPQRSGFLSSYFVLVGTHGLHVLIGIGWLVLMMAYVAIRGLTESARRRILNLSMFWHFLDVVWIFIFTFVYLLAAF